MTPCLLDAWLRDALYALGTHDAQDLPCHSGDLLRDLAAAQDAALRALLHRIRTRGRWRHKAPPGLDAVRGVADLLALPFTTAADLADWETFLCVPRGEVARMVTLHSSGTMGTPKRLAFSEADLARTRDFFRVGMAQLVRPGQTLLVLLPGSARPNGVADLLRQALPDVRVETLPDSLSGSWPDSPPDALPHALPEASPGTPPAPRCLAGHLLPLLEHTRPHAVVGAPSQLQTLLPLAPAPCLARLCHGGLLSSAEPLPLALRRHLEIRLGCLVLDHYGLTESGYGGGVECPAHNGYHLRALDLLVEIVDPCSGLPLQPGEEGEVVITTLNREAMPLVRYRTGDVASRISKWLAACTIGNSASP